MKSISRDLGGNILKIEKNVHYSVCQNFINLKFSVTLHRQSYSVKILYSGMGESFPYYDGIPYFRSSHGTHKSEEIFNLADSGHRNVSVSATAKVNFDSFVFTSVESCLDTLMQ